MFLKDTLMIKDKLRQTDMIDDESLQYIIAEVEKENVRY